MYRDRRDAGRQLAKALARFRDTQPVVLALPRGGVVLGAEVARALHAPLGLVIVRKISHPAAPEYAIGAIAEHDQPVFDELEVVMVDEDWLQQSIDATRAAIEQQRKQCYQNDILLPTIHDKVAILVDDGIATGFTMEAAVRYVRSQQPKQIIVAVPIAPSDSVGRLKHIVDEVITIEDPSTFRGTVGAHYQYFDQVTNEEVHMLLREVEHELSTHTTGRAQPARTVPHH